MKSFKYALEKIIRFILVILMCAAVFIISSFIVGLLLYALCLWNIKSPMIGIYIISLIIGSIITIMFIWHGTR